VLTGYAPYANHKAKYALIPPVHFSRQKKYPLVIGLSGYQWTPLAYATYAQSLAHCGAFVALTGLTFGANDETRLERFHTHTNNVLAIYNQLTANPSVDRDRVYLFAFSQSTLILNDLVRDYPGTWRGIILLNPGGTPENLPRDSRLKTVLASAGEVESQAQRFSQYQMELSQIGVPMRWYLEPDSAHFERSQNTLRDRTLLMIQTVFNE
jgi:predicted peptidase